MVQTRALLQLVTLLTGAALTGGGKTLLGLRGPPCEHSGSVRLPHRIWERVPAREVLFYGFPSGEGRCKHFRML